MLKTNMQHFSRRQTRRLSMPRILQLEARIVPAQPIGPEFQVNTYTTNSQQAPAVAVHDVGDFVVVWQSFGQDGSMQGVYGQRFDSAGVPEGSEFRANTYVIESQSSPKSAMAPNGDSIITWSSNYQDGSGAGVHAQRYNSAGLTQGPEFQVNTYTTSNQGSPSVAFFPGGDFVVVWASSGQDGSGFGIYGQRFTSTGTALGDEFRCNTHTSDPQTAVAVAADQSGNFVVAWMSRYQDGDDYGIFAQRYDNAGLPQGGEFQVNTHTTNQQGQPEIAMCANGDFVIGWESVLQDGSDYGVYARRYDSSGSPLGNEFLVNTYTNGRQENIDVAMDEHGNFTAVWETFGQDGNDLGVYGQEFRSDGTKRGTEFRINTYTSVAQKSPRIAMDDVGNYVVVWESGASTGTNQDGSGWGIYGQRYAAPPPEVHSIAVNDGAPQRSRVTSLAATFSTTMTFAGSVGSAFQLTRQGGGAVGTFTATAQTINGQTVVALSSFTGAETQFGSLVDGNYQLIVLASQVSNGVGQLDGNGDGTPGDNYIFNFHRLFGDANGDHTVNSGDFAAFRSVFGVGTSIFDFDNDGQTNSFDFAAFRGRFGLTVVP